MHKPVLLTIGPAILFLIIVGFIPLLFNIDLSLRDVTLSNLRGHWPHIGFDNYIRVLTDPRVLSSLGTTAIFVIASVTISLLIGTAFAVVLSHRLRGVTFFRTIQVIPLVVTPVVLAISWRFLLNPTYGLLSPLLRFLGLRDVALLSSPSTVLATVILIDVWIWTSLVTLIILGALESMPREPYEAAAVDGASMQQQFLYITLPLLRPALIIAVTLRIIDSLKTFGVIWVMTKGGPGFRTNLIGLEIYQRGLKFYYYSEAAALGIILLLVAIFVGNAFFKASERYNEA